MRSNVISGLGAATVTGRGNGVCVVGTPNGKPANQQPHQRNGRQRRPYLGGNLPRVSSKESAYAENDDPQPQVLVALGFLMTN
jgi:hypothetical protein